MPLNARLETSAGLAPSIEKTGDGERGLKVFHVPTHDESRALTAGGIPALREAWSTDRPGLVCVGLITEYLGGTDDPITGQNGRTHVRARYESLTARGRLPLRVPGETWTEEQVQSTTVQVLFPIEDPRTPYVIGPPLANGQGAAVEVTGVVLVVHLCKPREYVYDRRDYEPLWGKVNANAVTLPPAYPGALSQNYPPGTLRWRASQAIPSPESIEVVHTFVPAEDHLFRYRLEDSEGRGTTTVITSRLYASVDFPEL